MLTLTASSTYSTLYPEAFGNDVVYYLQKNTLLDELHPLYVHLTPAEELIYLIYDIDEWKIENQQNNRPLYAFITGCTNCYSRS